MRAISERELADKLDSLLDETIDEFKVGNLSYSASETFKSVDEMAYREELWNFIDSLINDGEIVEENGEYFQI